ncbi:MAG: saccharopine dehydrogenase NADP-binding domain-containing protein [Alphaproteobacteria bacterium]|nr:saccharopine dehydrogenase NADP-binding domain-containing protein [Alphaproteobacteria bacterium]
MARFVVFGLGMVGRSFLRLAYENALVSPENWFAVEKNTDFIAFFKKYNGLEANYIIADVNHENYRHVFSFLNEGDYLLDFSSFPGNTDLLSFCMEKGIHYLSTCSLPLEKDGQSLPDHHDFILYKELKKKPLLSKATSIIEFGMNPGMVSCFLKQGLKAIAAKDDTPFVAAHRDELQELIKNGQYALAAQKLGVEVVHISDTDTTQVNFQSAPDTIYSTWNPEAFREESTNFSEISLGSDTAVETFGPRIKEYDASDGYLRLKDSAAIIKDQSVSPWGSFTGHIVPHEEIYTIADFLSVRKDDRLIYKPSVYFVYKACDIARQSLSNNSKNVREHLISSDEISAGGEAVGIVLDGKNFKTRYFGNRLEIPIKEDTPTILQVSASAYAAFRYMLDNPSLGFLFPEELDDEKLLEYARPYLKEYVTFTCPPLERHFKKAR